MLKRRRRNTAEYSTHLQQLRCVKSKYPSFVPWRRQDPYCLHEPLHYSRSWMFLVAPWEFPMSRCVHILLVLQGLHLLVRHLQQFKQVRGTIFNSESSVIKYCIGFTSVLSYWSRKFTQPSKLVRYQTSANGRSLFSRLRQYARFDVFSLFCKDRCYYFSSILFWIHSRIPAH